MQYQSPVNSGLKVMAKVNVIVHADMDADMDADADGRVKTNMIYLYLFTKMFDSFA